MQITWRETAGKYVENPRLMVLGAILLGLIAAAGILATGSLLLPLAALASLLVGGLILTRPNFGLAVVVFVTYTRFSDVVEKHHGFPSFILPLALLLMAALVWQWWFGGKRLPNWEITALLLGTYALVGFASLLYAVNPDRSLDALIEFAKNSILVFAVFLLLRQRKSLHYAIWALVAAGIFMGSITVYQQLTGTFDNSYWGFAETEVKTIVGSVTAPRVAGPLDAPNFYAMVLVALVPVALDRVWHEKKTALRLLALWSLVVCLLSIVFTFSRGGFLALLVVLILLMHQLFTPKRLLLAALLFLTVWQFLPANYTDRLATTFDLFSGNVEELRSDVSFRGRTSEVLVAWLIFKDYPILGIGLNNYKISYQEYAQPLGWDNRREERSAHSLYLETAAETGLVGLATLGLILAAAIRNALQAQRVFTRNRYYDEASMSKALAIGMAGYLVASIFLHSAYPRYFWLLIGILLALPHVAISPAAMRFAPLSRPELSLAPAAGRNDAE